MPKVPSSQPSPSKQHPYSPGSSNTNVRSQTQAHQTPDKRLQNAIKAIRGEGDPPLEEMDHLLEELADSGEKVLESMERKKERLSRYKAKVLGLEKNNKQLKAKAVGLEHDKHDLMTNILQLELENLELREQLFVANQAIAAAKRTLTNVSPDLPAAGRSNNAGPGGAPLTVYLKTPNGKTSRYDTHKYETVDTLKAKICDKEGTAPHEQRIIHHGRQLEDGRTLGAYGVQHEDTLHLVYGLRGC